MLARPNGQGFAIFSGDRLVGMSCYIGIEAARGVLEIGNTYYVPALRGSGLNRAVKDLMIGRAIDCGFRRIEFRVDARNARSQARDGEIGRGPRGRDPGRADHLDRPCPRHHIVLDPRARMGREPNNGA